MTADAPVNFHTPPSRPTGARILNTMGRGLSVLGIETPRLTGEAITKAAVRTSGFSDFGSDSYLAAMEPLLFSLEHEANLNQLGRIVLHGQIVSALASRLAVVAWEKANPDLAQAPVKAPLIIVGMPRTGTTILYETLAAAPHLRAPLTWECRDYALAHQITDPHNDPRIEKLGKAMSRNTSRDGKS